MAGAAATAVNMGNATATHAPKPGPGGMTAYPPMAIGIVCIMLEAGRITYRKTAGIPRSNHAMATKMGLKKSPP